MSKVFCLSAARSKRRRQFIDHNGDRLDHFIKHFFHHHLDVDFPTATKRYISECVDTDQQSWDYLDFREAVREALANTVGKEIIDGLKKTHWYDPSVMSSDEVFDRCVSLFVLEDWAAVSY